MRCTLLCALVAACAVAALAAEHQSETLANGLKIEYVYTLEGCEPKSKNNDMLTMHYTGKLVDGTKFDSR
ncbi:FK506-binding protein 1 [Aphis craccivora]|uniref:FK506-binding protein 1 n=1 Tax=Aphis craccivora TaxID=307492 RepID=A0A6G0Z5E3_APHCR|nr:FK506-binding protein 1 [Aphis craccivora]